MIVLFCAKLKGVNTFYSPKALYVNLTSDVKVLLIFQINSSKRQSHNEVDNSLPPHEEHVKKVAHRIQSNIPMNPEYLFKEWCNSSDVEVFFQCTVTSMLGVANVQFKGTQWSF